MGLITIAGAIGKLYYLLTAYLPRRLPSTPEEYERFKNVLVECYGVPDTANSWIVVSGQITSTEATQIRKAWGSIANAAKRMDINTLAANQSLVHRKEKAMADMEKAETNRKKQHEINTIIEAHFARDAGGAGAFLEKQDLEDSELVSILEDEFPNEGGSAEWVVYIKWLAGETVAKRIKEQSNGNQDSQKQPLTDGNTVPQTPEEYAKKVQ